MARKRFASGLSRAGNGIFRFLSRCEERGILPGISRILKISLLGLVVSSIASCCKVIPPLVTCYKPAVVHPQVTELEISPNPTNGAETVKVTAKARLIDMELDSTVFITSARCTLDTLEITMKAEDGAFDGTEEEIQAELPASNLPPCTTLIHVFVESNNGFIGSDAEYLYITGKTD